VHRIVAPALVFSVLLVTPGLLAQDCPEPIGEWPWGMAYAAGATD
jgi:hypothetical protein